jgi:hypothetical protein
MIAWKPFNHEDQVYDLTHLHPRAAQFIQPAQGGKPERTYSVNIGFGLHCFTRGLKPNEAMPENLAYSDSRETRVFDFSRFEYSKLLNGIVEALPSSPCFHTAHGTFLTVRQLNPTTQTMADYEVYFTASRSGTKPASVNLFVQSAYVRDQEHENPPKKKKIGFFVILHNVLANKPIKPGT